MLSGTDMGTDVKLRPVVIEKVPGCSAVGLAPLPRPAGRGREGGTAPEAEEAREVVPQAPGTHQKRRAALSK